MFEPADVDRAEVKGRAAAILLPNLIEGRGSGDPPAKLLLRDGPTTILPPPTLVEGRVACDLVRESANVAEPRRRARFTAGNSRDPIPTSEADRPRAKLRPVLPTCALCVYIYMYSCRKIG